MISIKTLVKALIGKQIVTLLSIAGLLFIFVSCWMLLFIRSNKFNSSSVLSNKENNESNEPKILYQNILKFKTADNYPPNDLFPKNLDPKYKDNFDISAQAYAVMVRDSGELLYAVNATTRYPIASITKIMTSIIALENADLTSEFSVSPYVAKIGEASMGLTTGERLTLEDLLYGMMLPSGNDAAETVAEGVGIKYLTRNNLPVDRRKGREWFITEMNRKAQSLGMMDTYFFNPTGLDGETKGETSFSTALDFLALTNYALNNPTFAQIVQTKNYHIPYKENFHKEFYLENILKLDEAFKGIKGIKPGNSIFARETLVSYVERDGRKIIAVILGSNFTKDDILKIYKRIFST